MGASGTRVGSRGRRRPQDRSAHRGLVSHTENTEGTEQTEERLKGKCAGDGHRRSGSVPKASGRLGTRTRADGTPSSGMVTGSGASRLPPRSLCSPRSPCAPCGERTRAARPPRLGSPHDFPSRQKANRGVGQIPPVSDAAVLARFRAQTCPMPLPVPPPRVPPPPPPARAPEGASHRTKKRNRARRTTTVQAPAPRDTALFVRTPPASRGTGLATCSLSRTAPSGPKPDGQVSSVVRTRGMSRRDASRMCGKQVFPRLSAQETPTASASRSESMPPSDRSRTVPSRLQLRSQRGSPRRSTISIAD